jgi:hypothetical protein
MSREHSNCTLNWISKYTIYFLLLYFTQIIVNAAEQTLQTGFMCMRYSWLRITSGIRPCSTDLTAWDILYIFMIRRCVPWQIYNWPHVVKLITKKYSHNELANWKPQIYYLHKSNWTSRKTFAIALWFRSMKPFSLQASWQSWAIPFPMLVSVLRNAATVSTLTGYSRHLPSNPRPQLSMTQFPSRPWKL